LVAVDLFIGFALGAESSQDVEVRKQTKCHTPAGVYINNIGELAVIFILSSLILGEKCGGRKLGAVKSDFNSSSRANSSP